MNEMLHQYWTLGVQPVCLNSPTKDRDQSNTLDDNQKQSVVSVEHSVVQDSTVPSESDVCLQKLVWGRSARPRGKWHTRVTVFK